MVERQSKDTATEQQAMERAKSWYENQIMPIIGEYRLHRFRYSVSWYSYVMNLEVALNGQLLDRGFLYGSIAMIILATLFIFMGVNAAIEDSIRNTLGRKHVKSVAFADGFVQRVFKQRRW